IVRTFVGVGEREKCDRGNAEFGRMLRSLDDEIDAATLDARHRRDGGTLAFAVADEHRPDQIACRQAMFGNETAAPRGLAVTAHADRWKAAARRGCLIVVKNLRWRARTRGHRWPSVWWLGHWFTDEPVMQCGSDVVVIAGLAGKWTPDDAARSNASALIVIPAGTQCRAGTQRGCRRAGSRVSPKRLARDDNKI